MWHKTQMAKEKLINFTLSKLKMFVNQIALSIEKNKPNTEKIFTNHLSNMHLGPWTYKKLLQLNNKKTTELKYGKGIEPKSL